MFDEAEQLLEQARNLGEECADKVEAYEKSKKARTSGGASGDDRKRPPEYY